MKHENKIILCAFFCCAQTFFDCSAFIQVKMSSFQDSHSAMLSDEVTASQAFSPGSNNQDMVSTLTHKEVPVSDSEMKSSSSGHKDQMLSHVCAICSKAFSRKFVLVRHIKFHSEEKPFRCEICEKQFVQKSDLLRHKVIHSKMATMHNCNQCSEVFSRKYDLLKHRKIHKCLKEYKCMQCSEKFTRKSDLLKHGKIHKYLKEYKCIQCSEVFSRKFDLLKHEKIHKCPKQHKCVQCSEVFNNKSDLFSHVRSLHKVTPSSKDSSLKDMLYEKVKHFKRQNALNVFTQTRIDSNEDNDKDFHIFFNSIRSDVLNELNYQMEEKKRFKWYAVAQVLLTRVTSDGDLETATPYFHSKTILELTNNNLSGNIEDAFAKIIDSFEKFTSRGSGWTLEKISYLEVSTAKCGIV